MPEQNHHHAHLRNFAEREKMLPSRPILLNFGLRAGQRLADMGAGYGFFALPAAEIVGPGGMIAAVDINREGLAELEKRAADRGVAGTIRTYVADAAAVPLPDGCVDIVLISMVLHELADPLGFLKEAHRIVGRGGGQVWVIEWRKKEGTMGPPLPERRYAEEWIGLLAEAGFENIWLHYHESAFVLFRGSKS